MHMLDHSNLNGIICCKPFSNFRFAPSYSLEAPLIFEHRQSRNITQHAKQIKRLYENCQNTTKIVKMVEKSLKF